MPDKSDSPEKSVKVNFLTQTRFDEFDLHPEIFKGLDTAGFEFCSPIQSQVLPLSLTGRDIAGQAQTGTGKTAAFLLTILARFLKEPPDETPSKKKRPSALIIAPTRELAMQIHEEAEMLSGDANLKMVRVIGGIDYDKQAEELRNGVDMVICTPGRLIDYMKQKIFDPSAIKTVVIDEADRLLDLGFEKDMRFILSKLPHYEKRQSMLFSATLSYRVLELTYQYMNLPEFISVVPDNTSIKGIEQSLFHVGNDKKLSLLLGVLNRESTGPILIFVNTKAGVEWLAEKLKGNGFQAEGITGDLPQRKRLQLMKQFKDGKINMLVATDVASRGIHVENISHVINYDLPQEAENYVHRIGRTARAGKTGKAISFACENYVFYLEAIEKMIGDKIPVLWPEDEWFSQDKAGPVARKYGNHSRGKKSPDKRPSHKKGPNPQRKNGKTGSYGRAGDTRRPSEMKSNRFPGSFFGFAPPSEGDKESDAKKKKVSEKNGPEKNGPEKNGPEKNGPDPKNVGKKKPDPKGSDKKSSEKKRPAKRSPKKDSGQTTKNQNAKNQSPKNQSPKKESAPKKPIKKQSADKQTPEEETAKKESPKKKPTKRVNKKEPGKRVAKKDSGKQMGKEGDKPADKKKPKPANKPPANKTEKKTKPSDKKATKKDTPLDTDKKPDKKTDKRKTVKTGQTRDKMDKKNPEKKADQKIQTDPKAKEAPEKSAAPTMAPKTEKGTDKTPEKTPDKTNDE